MAQRVLSRLKHLAKQPRTWIIVLSLALATSLVIAGAALAGVRSLVEPPEKGQFYEVLQGEALKNPVNTTGTLFEHTLDELSGGVIPLLLFPNSTKFCGDDGGFDMKIAACVDRFNPTYVALSQEFSENYQRAYESAVEAGLEEEAERINQWESHVAAHEFAHVLQYNYREATAPYQKDFEAGRLGQPQEDMAECYAQLLYPMSDDVAQKKGDSIELTFHNFPAAERFALCTEDQLDSIRGWLKAIPYPEGNKVEISSASD